MVWGHRNGYAICFAPDDHPLAGQLLVGEDGADERGSRPSNGAPEVLSVDYQAPPARRSTRLAGPLRLPRVEPSGVQPGRRAVGRSLRLRSGQSAGFCTPASLQLILSEDVPIADVLAFPPAPIALEAADSSFTGIDFVPKSFVTGPVLPGAALYSLEGDLGFCVITR
jgi:hypothetical protein